MSTAPPRVALYLRVSTSDQSTALQRADLEALCQRRGWSVSAIYEDHLSGAKDSRPDLDAMMQAVRQGKVDLVLVWRFDRFARSLQHLLAALQAFREHRVDFVSYSEQIDTTTPAGKLLFSLLGAIAEFERSLIQERVRAGVRRARESGVRFGRPRKGFDVARAVELYRAGSSLREIARQLKVSRSTVHAALMGIEQAVRKVAATDPPTGCP